jgi:M6 family metalloprotease-like protein
MPVLMALFSNSEAPFPVEDLQKELWPTGTMTAFCEEISNGAFSVSGKVYPWKKLAETDSYYEGLRGPRPNCNGMCEQGKVGDLIQELVAANDAEIDFSQYDDGPDGQPNSGNDDGFVDFIAIVHPESGGECGNRNIWSHRFAVSGLLPQAIETNDPGIGASNIRIDDYVIQPALSCLGGMIEIGVFAHEFGHAFGPDIYDTDYSTDGVGTWCLWARAVTEETASTRRRPLICPPGQRNIWDGRRQPT